MSHNFRSLATITPWRPADQLRQALIEMRADLIDRMQRRGAAEPAHLPLIAGINAALEALDRSAERTSADAAAVDGTSGRIKLIVYRDGAAVAATELLPTAAIRLGGELLACAGLRLADDLAELRAKDSR